ncbi:Oxygen oxidoreductase covalent FAD-binding site [Sesbania bispinosa]|nr:Oxygen oxidoreductase covalent FAD-binding site [Sesbania bispinosa]
MGVVENYPSPTYLILLLITITRLISTVGKTEQWKALLPPELEIESLSQKLRNDPEAIEKVSRDFGNVVHDFPAAVFEPSSVQDIVSLVKLSENSSVPFKIAARGQGHSTRGQAMARDGVVVDMARFRERGNGVGIRVFVDPLMGRYYADVGGEELWIDVLKASLEYGVAPSSWTDYLYLTVGGTLSNAGISGQTFRYGPQISIVLQMDVITGKGELVTCSPQRNSELFHAVLGGLGQFGIITRARIALKPAPKREIQVMLQGLSYIPGFYYEKNVSFVEFLNRVRSGELKLQSQGLWDVPHPWLNLWDNKMSACIPEEDVFYAVGFLHSSGYDNWKAFDAQNREILKYCNDAGIKLKQYLPHYSTQEDWTKHFGSKWGTFLERKHQFDPRMILSPGQRIFNNN